LRKKRKKSGKMRKKSAKHGEQANKMQKKKKNPTFECKNIKLALARR